MSEGEGRLSFKSMLRSAGAYLRRIFWYSRFMLMRRHRSYRSMFAVSLVILTFVFTNLILNEARILGTLSSSFGGTHHVMFLGLDGEEAKTAAEHEGVKDCIIVPVIAKLESSAESATVGKLAVLTEEIADFMQVGITHGTRSTDNGILLPRNLYAAHPYLRLGTEQDMFFESDRLICRRMSLDGLYSCTDSESPYIFVNETTGEAIKAETGHTVTFDVYLTLKIDSDRNAAKVAGEIIRRCGIRDSDAQQINAESGDERRVYADYINVGAASYRYRNGLDINRAASAVGLIIGAVIMASFMTSHTMRHMGEYGVLAAYGAGRRHLFGTVMTQTLFVTVLSLVPVLLLSMGGASVYEKLYNSARLADALPVIMGIPRGTMLSHAVWYLLLLTFVSYLSLGKALAAFPAPMIRGTAGERIPFVSRSSRFLERTRDKVGHIALLQALRKVKGDILPAIAASVICVLCAAFLGYNIVSVTLWNGKADDYGANLLDGTLIPITQAGESDLSFRGYITEEAMARLASFDGVKTVGGLRTEMKVTDSGQVYFGMGTFRGEGTESIFIPYYCDQAILPYLYETVTAGDPTAIFTDPHSLILVDNTPQNGSPYTVGDTLTVVTDTAREEMRVAAVVTGGYLPDLDLNMTDGCMILSNEAGEMLDGFPHTMRKTVYFTFDDTLTEEEVTDLCRRIREDTDLLRYQVSFTRTSQRNAAKMARLENGTTAVFFGMLYFALCVLDYYNSKERIYAERKAFCTLRQLGAREKDIRRTTGLSVLPAQLLSLGVTAAIAFFAVIVVLWYTTNLANMYRMSFEGRPDILERMLAMVREMRRTYFGMIGGVTLLSLPFHLLAALTAHLGTVLPTRHILRENIAETLKGGGDV